MASELEQRCQELAMHGYYACISRRRDDWHVWLFNHTLPRVPQGTGPTAIAALEAALADRSGVTHHA